LEVIAYDQDLEGQEAKMWLGSTYYHTQSTIFCGKQVGKLGHGQVKIGPEDGKKWGFGLGSLEKHWNWEQGFQRKSHGSTQSPTGPCGSGDCGVEFQGAVPEQHGDGRQLWGPPW
jgi:hypothetical protein